MNLLNGWTGKSACSLQAALHLSNEAFAKHLPVSLRTVNDWHKNPAQRPQSATQQLLDKSLDEASDPVKSRFAELEGGLTGQGSARDADARQAEEAARARLDSDPNISSALSWLDQHAHWPHDTGRREVALRLAQIDLGDLLERGRRRGRIDRRQVTRALNAYYPDRTESHGLYSAQYATGCPTVTTSIITSADWLDVACPLFPSTDRLTLASRAEDDLVLDQDAAGRAAQRLAETLALGIRFVDMPLYRLLDVDIRTGIISGSVGLDRFMRYALTMDLLEGELIDALAAGTAVEPGALPLRDQHLPDLATVLDFPNRLCAGGTLALCAIARPENPYRGPADYVLLVQERSGHVVNAAGRLAVIPKGFHQPMMDFGADTQLGATLRREMEEELFGREDTDNTVGPQRAADPMHPSRMSEPMQWLMEDTARLRMEGTGFGLNLVSGNFEFPGLIVIDDEEFWSRYGGAIEANWESSGMRQYSSLNPSALVALIDDVAWSNEGLFALLQGLRRLGEIGGARVDLPEIQWTVD